MNYWRSSALKETDETEREYHRHMIGGWHSSHVGLYVKKDSLLDELKTAAKAKDYGMMQKLIFTYNKRELSWHFSSSCDHCFIAHSVLQKDDTVVFKDISRFTREAENGYKKYMEWLERGINIVFIDNPTVSSE